MADFNSKQYEWADVTVAYGGRTINGILGVEYTAKKDKELLYGRGNKPWGIQSGNFSYEGKLELWQSEVIAMEGDAPKGEILNLEFDITIAYAPEGSEKIVTKTLKGAQVTEHKEGMSQGDKMMKVELPIIFRDIKIHT